MSEEYNSNNEIDVKIDQESDLHKNQDIKEEVEGKATGNNEVKAEEKEMKALKKYDSPYSVVIKAIPYAFGIASIGIIITVVLYLILK